MWLLRRPSKPCDLFLKRCMNILLLQRAALTVPNKSEGADDDKGCQTGVGRTRISAIPEQEQGKSRAGKSRAGKSRAGQEKSRARDE